MVCEVKCFTIKPICVDQLIIVVMVMVVVMMGVVPTGRGGGSDGLIQLHPLVRQQGPATEQGEEGNGGTRKLCYLVYLLDDICYIRYLSRERRGTAGQESYVI